MEKRNARRQRFDETFKILLVIATITMTFSLNFYRDVLSISFFLEFFSSFVFSVILWSAYNMIGGFYEYLCKLGAWHLLTFAMVTSFERLILGKLQIPPLLGLINLFVITFPTFRIKRWLEEVEAVPDDEYTISKQFKLLISFWTAIQMVYMVLTW